jgi:acyl transferase domain-containing protein
LDLREIIYPPADKVEAAPTQLKQTAITQPALFVIEYALARLWMSWGIEPAAMAGHSIGEYAAACLAGVFSLEDALRLVAERGRLMQELPEGAMLAVRLPEIEIQELLGSELSLAAVNGANQCVVSGAAAAIDPLHQQLTERGVMCHRLETSRAFHSPMVEPALEPFTAVVRQIALHPPRIPFISNVSGTWITNEQATDPAYWAQHMRRTVRFADGTGELLKKAAVLLEVGPGQILSALTRQHPAKGHQSVIVSSLPNAQLPESEIAAMLAALGQLTLAGATVNWAGFYAQERRQRVSLPSYPFERKRFWVESTPAALVPPPVKAQQYGTDSLPGSVRKPELAPANGATRSEAMDAGKQTIKSELQVLFGKLLGSDLTAINGETNFLEMGFDSLMLTQASRSIEKQFGARIPFGQLLARFSTFELLAVAVEKGARSAAATPAQKKANLTGANQPNDEPMTSLLNQ